MPRSARQWLDRIRELDLPARFPIMNVCGGHERSISQTGLRSLLPPQIELIPGPGCPVCVCPEERLYQAIRTALDHDVVLVAFGDLLRVPANGPRDEPRSLMEARAAGADIRAIASPTEAAAIAEAESRPVVFFAAGFETTMAPLAALLAQGIPDNLYLLLAGRLTWPAVAMLLESGKPGFEGLIAPGHVATVMGAEEWQFAPKRHGIPTAVAGFDAESLLAAIYSVIRQSQENRPCLDNCYAEAVSPEGNPTARSLLQSELPVVDAEWRGIGTIPRSGFTLASHWHGHDADRHFPVTDHDRRRAGEMPPGCECAAVVLGQCYPDRCPLFGRACTPGHPIGPCMVSDEGACRIWWESGQSTHAATGS